MNMDNIVVGLVIAGAIGYLCIKLKNMLKPGGSCGGG